MDYRPVGMVGDARIAHSTTIRPETTGPPIAGAQPGDTDVVIDWDLLLMIGAIGLTAGFLSGLLGIGGGIIITPLLLYMPQLAGASARAGYSS